MYHAKPEVIQKWTGELLEDQRVAIPWDHAEQFREALMARGFEEWNEYRHTPESDNIYFLIDLNYIEEDIQTRLYIMIVINVVFDQRPPCPHYLPADCCLICEPEKYRAKSLEV